MSMNQNGRYLLDTNIVIAIFADEIRVQERRRSVDKVFLPSPAIGELYFGARKSDRSTENLAKINEIIQQILILPSIYTLPNLFLS